jgi:hypothetical protein
MDLRETPEPTFTKLLLSAGFVEVTTRYGSSVSKFAGGVIEGKVAVFSYSHNLVSR